MSGRGVAGARILSGLRRRAARPLLAASLALLPLGSLGAACSDRPDDGTAPRPVTEELPALVLRDDTANLLLTWLDDRGDTHVELRPADVPAEGRSPVRVVLSDREHGTRDLVYVADLTQKGGDGAYAVRTMRRRDWEDLIEKRRAAHIAKTAPPPQPTPASSPGAQPPAQGVAGAVTVIIYGASWCAPCHQAADHARSRGATVIIKDIEQDRAAAAEMQSKLAKSNQHGGSIPIIDVRGQILVGFSPSALDRALSRAASGTAL